MFFLQGCMKLGFPGGIYPAVGEENLGPLTEWGLTLQRSC